MSQSLFAKSPSADPSAAKTGGAADHVEPLLDWFFVDEIPMRFEFWDGTAIGPESALGTVAVRSANALRRLSWAPTELGLARAYVAGDLDLEGDVFEMLAVLDSKVTDRKIFPGGLIAAIAAGRAVGALAPLPVPAEEARVRGRRHTKRHDARAISHHYDVGNDFYELVLFDTDIDA